MSRYKNYDSTGVAPAGRLYAGDLHGIQDHYLDTYNLTQNGGIGSVAIGEAGLQVMRYGAGEMRISGALRTDGILRGLGGMIPGAFTTAQRDAIPVGGAPYGIEILNTTNNRFEWNSGNDGARSWKPLDGAPAFLVGTEAARPAATALNSGTGYYATDTTYEYVSNGSAWLRVGVPAPAAAFLTGTEAARPAASAANAGTGYYATDSGVLYVSNGSVWTQVGIKTTNRTFASGPPSGPNDGDIWNATDVGQGAGSWQFVYRAAEPTYKWHFIGGAPLSAEVATAEALSPGTGFVDLATVGPSVTISRAGDYMARHTAYLSNLQANAGYISLSGCGITPSIDDSALLSSGTVNTVYGATVSKAARRTLTAGTLKLQYSTVAGAGGAQLSYQNRFLDVTPVRIS